MSLPIDASSRFGLPAARAPLAHVFAVVIAPLLFIERRIIVVVFTPVLAAHLALALLALLAADQRSAQAAITRAPSVIGFDPSAAPLANFTHARLAMATRKTGN